MRVAGKQNLTRLIHSGLEGLWRGKWLPLWITAIRGRRGVPLGGVDAVAPALTPLECPGVLAGRFWESAEECGRRKRSGA